MFGVVYAIYEVIFDFQYHSVSFAIPIIPNEVAAIMISTLTMKWYISVLIGAITVKAMLKIAVNIMPKLFAIFSFENILSYSNFSLVDSPCVAKASLFA